MDEQHRRVQQYYGDDPEGFDRFWAPVLHGMSIDLLPHLPLERARRVVEVGCGTGGLLSDLRAAAPAATVVGADLTEAMLRVARGRVDTPLAVMAAERLGLQDGCVDAAVFAFVLHRVGQPLEALREVVRVLRPGGAVGVVTWGATEVNPASRVWDEEVAGLGLPGQPSPGGSHGVLDEPGKLERLLGEAGLVRARAWRRRFERAASAEEWLRAQTAYGGRRLLARLAEPERRALLARVATRVQALAPEAFTQRSDAVYGVGYTARALRQT